MKTEFLFGPVPHKEAVDFIASKPVVSKDVFAQLLPELKGRAFTIAGLEGSANVMQAIRDRIAELPAGARWDDVKKDVARELTPFFLDPDADPDARDGQVAAATRRAELLIRTHGFQAYQAAAVGVARRQQDVFPYWQYASLEDGRVRPSHAALDGVVLRADHEFWKAHTPPWDWGCRCQIIPLTEEDVADIKEQDKTRPADQQQVLEGPALHGITPEGGRRLLRNGRNVTLQAPSESGKPGAFRFSPDDMRLDFEQLRSRYDAKAWESFETWAQNTHMDNGLTVLEWGMRLNGSRLLDQYGLAPAEFAGWKPVMTRAEADVYTAASQIQGSVYHGTEFPGSLDRAGVLIPLNQWTARGRGFYLSQDPALARKFGGKLVETRILAKNPWRGTEAEFDAWLDRSGLSRDRRGTDMDPTEWANQVTRKLMTQGYDAAVVSGIFKGQAGVEVVAYDQRQVVIVKGSSAPVKPFVDDVQTAEYRILTRRQAEALGRKVVQDKSTYLPAKGTAAAERLAALHAYQSTDYIGFNTALRGTEPIGLRMYAKQIAALDTAIMNSQLPSNITLWRGLGDKLDNLKPGQVLSDPAYLSTSVLKQEATTFAHQAIIEIRAPKGLPAFYMDSINASMKHEEEFLLPRDARLRVLEIKIVAGVQHVVCEYHE